MRNKVLIQFRAVRVCIAFFLACFQVCPAVYAQSNPLPTGEQAVAGNVSFDRSNLNHFDVYMTTQNGIVNYQTFDVGSGYAANFYLPNSSATILNRVIGVDPSTIAGRLTSNGNVWIVNPNGVFFGPGSSIDVHGLLASTLNITDENFMAGNYQFFKDGKSAFIDNQGELHVVNGGYVILLAQAIRNGGSIEANVGTVSLASGDAMTVALDDHSDISVVVDRQVQESVFDFDGNQIKTAIDNQGSIKADGGKITLTSQSLNSIFDYAINNTGIVQASSLENNGGVIELVADGDIVNDFIVEASTVYVLASGSTFINNGRVIADGSSLLIDGGKILINADRIIQAGHISANAYEGGQAGEIDLVSQFFTIAKTGSLTEARAFGLAGVGGSIVFNSIVGNTAIERNAVIDVSGGATSGDAGFVEISATLAVGFWGSVVGNAADGYRLGNLFFDPRDITIQAGGTDTPTGNNATGTPDEALGDNAGLDLIIDSTALKNTYLNEIYLQATRDIFLNSALESLSQSVRLEAGNDLTLAANLSTTGSAITLIADFDGDGSGAFVMNSGVSIASSGGEITISSGETTIIRSINSGTSASQNVNITSTHGSIQDDSNDTTKITANTLTLKAKTDVGAAGASDLDTAAKNLIIRKVDGSAIEGFAVIDNSSTITAKDVKVANNFDLTARSGNLNVASIEAAGNVTLIADSGPVEEDFTDIDGGVDISANNLTIKATSGIGINGGNPIEINVNSLTAHSRDAGISLVESNAITLTSVKTGVNLTSGVAEGTGGNITITAGGNMTVTEVSATRGSGDDVSLTTTSSGTMTVSSIAAADDVTLNSAGTITDGNGVTTNVTGNNFNVTSNGTIDLDTTVSSLTASSSGGNITIDETSGLEVKTVNAGSGEVALTLAAGAITDGNVGATNITASQATITTQTGINLDTAVTTLTATSNNGGNIDIDNNNSSNSSITAEVKAAAGDIALSQTGAGNLTVTKAITNDGKIDADVTSGDLIATEIFTGGTSRNITLTTTTSGDVFADNVKAFGDKVTINSAGAILEKVGDTNLDIITSIIDLDAATGIGTAADIFEIRGDRISADTGSGGINIINGKNTAITVSSLTADSGNIDFIHNTAGVITFDSVIARNGSVDLLARNDNLIATSVTAAGTGKGITLKTGVGGGSITATAVSTSDGGITLETATGNITATSVTAVGTAKNITLKTITSGNIFVGNVTATGDKITVNSKGSIEEIGAGDLGIDLTATTLDLDAVSGIGATTGIETSATSIAATSTGTGKIDLNNNNSSTTTVTSMTTGTAGDIEFNQTGGGVLAVTFARSDTSGNVTIEASNGVTATQLRANGTGKDINVQTTGGNISVGDLNAADDVVINSAGTVVDTNGADSNKVRGDNLNVTAQGLIDIDTVVTSIDANSNGNNITIDELNAVTVNEINAGAGDVALTLSFLTVTDGNGNDTNVTADNFNVSTKGVIDLDTAINSLDANSNGSNIIINETNGLAVNVVDAGAGDVTIALAAGAITDGNGATTTNITADEVTLNAVTGINIDTAVITLNATTTGGDIDIDESNGLAINVVNAGAGDVVIDLAAGAIIDNNGNANNITANEVKLTAIDGIGSTNALETTIDRFEASNTNGDIKITNTGALTLVAKNLGQAISNTSGNVNVIASSPLTVDSNVTAGGAITLTATNDTGNDDHLTVGANIQSTGSGLITLGAGTDFIQNVGTISTDGNVDIDAVRNITQNGGNITGSTLFADASGNISLTQSTNDLGALNAESTGTGAIQFTDTNAVTLADVETNNGLISVIAGGQLTAEQVTTNSSNNITLRGSSVAVNNVQAVGNQITITAVTGAITESGADATVDLTATTLDLDAVTGIGTPINAIETAATSISADTTNGNINIDNTAVAATAVTSLTTGAGNILFSQFGGGPLTLAKATTADGDIGIDVTGANLTAIEVGAGGSGQNITLTTTTSGNILLENITATDDAVTVNAAGSVLDNDANESNGITAATASITAGSNIGSSATDGDIDINVETLTLAAGGDVFLQEQNSITVSSLTAASATLLTGDETTLETITTTNDFVLRTTLGDVIFDGITTSTAGAVNVQVDAGNIRAQGGNVTHLIANADSLLSTPNGTIATQGAPLRVNVTGNLILDIGDKQGNTSGRVVGTVNSLPSNIPLLLPASLSQPIRPPGNVFFNGVRIWPTTASFQLSQTQASNLSVASFSFPAASQLGISQVNTSDVISSALRTPVAFYHPLTAIDSAAYDEGFFLEEGAYEFIDGNLQGENNDDDDKKVKLEHEEYEQLSFLY